MAHRIAKKQHQQRLQNQNQQSDQSIQNNQQTQNTNYYHNQPQISSSSTSQNPQNRLPRPIIPSVDKIYVHDKSSYRQHRLAFPPAQSLFVSSNNYDAGPQFLRPTSAFTFSTPKKSQFPLGVWITPFGSQRVHKIKVNSPLRCSRCKAYINGYFRFDGTKTTAICNICSINFQIDTSNTDPNNLNSTQIATQGVIDFVVKDKIFIKKRIDIVKIIFVIQINSFIIQSNAFNIIIDSIKSNITNNQFQKNVRIGFVLYNGQGITYLKLSNRQGTYTQKHPKKYTVKYSTQGLCCPLSDAQMLYNPNTQKQQILYILQNIQRIAQQQYKNSKYITQGSNYAMVLKSIMQNFDQQIGRIMLFSHTVPRYGYMGLRPRTQQDNKNQLKPLNMDYYQLSKQLVKARIGIDMYFICKQPLSSQELATTHYLATHTGGSIHYYSPYISQNHSQNLYYNIYGSLSRKYVYDVNFTARFSNGLNVSSFGINDGIHQTRDISLGIFDPLSSIIVTYQQQQKILQNNAAFIQFAIMFTTGQGQRIIRIINYRFQVTNKIQQIHQACDYLTVANILLRQTVHRMLKNGGSDVIKIRDDLINRLISIITEYVQDGNNKIKNNNIFMSHQNIGSMFAYVHSFINSKVFLNAGKLPNDIRIMQALKINMSNFLTFTNHLYPKLYSLGMQIYENTPIPGDIIQGQDYIQQSITLPPNLSLTNQSIIRQGIYLNWLDNYLLIMIQPGVNDQLLEQIFGTNNWDQIQQMNTLPQLQTSHNIRINMIIQELRNRTIRNNGIFLPLLIRTAKKKGSYFQLLSNIMKQDYLQCKYYSFMDAIHRNVQLRLK